MTEAQARNLASARAMAARAIGWTGDTKAIPYDRREAYATELAKVILAYPAQFDAVTVSIARAELSDSPNAPLGDYTTGEAVKTFFGEALNQAAEIGESVASVGEGVKTTLSLASVVIPAAALFAVYVVLRNFSRRAS